MILKYRHATTFHDTALKVRLRCTQFRFNDPKRKYALPQASKYFHTLVI